MTVPAPFRARRTPYTNTAPNTGHETHTHGINGTGGSAHMSNSERARAETFVGSGASRKVVSNMMWRAFPGPSEAAVSERASLVLGLSDRHARRLLRGEHDASATIVMALMALIGFEAALSMIIKGAIR